MPKFNSNVHYDVELSRQRVKRLPKRQHYRSRWPQVGSRNEKPGITGISHFLEHMMFKGWTRAGSSSFEIVLETSGGSNNAYTTRDVTVYSDWFSKSALRNPIQAVRLATEPKPAAGLLSLFRAKVF